MQITLLGYVFFHCASSMRVLPSGLITYRVPYIDAAGKRRSKKFARKSDADLLTVASELVHGAHTPVDLADCGGGSQALYRELRSSGSSL